MVRFSLITHGLARWTNVACIVVVSMTVIEPVVTLGVNENDALGVVDIEALILELSVTLVESIGDREVVLLTELL